jgi:hypothetical protein
MESKKISERLKIESQQEENDYKSLGLSTKSLREARLERFEENDYISKLKEANCIIVPFNGSKVVIDTQTNKFGVLDYFPKANKVLIRKNNQWKTQGLNWMLKNIIKTHKN